MNRNKLKKKTPLSTSRLQLENGRLFCVSHLLIICAAVVSKAFVTAFYNFDWRLQKIAIECSPLTQLTVIVCELHSFLTAQRLQRINCNWDALITFNAEGVICAPTTHFNVTQWRIFFSSSCICTYKYYLVTCTSLHKFPVTLSMSKESKHDLKEWKVGLHVSFLSKLLRLWLGHSLLEVAELKGLGWDTIRNENIRGTAEIELERPGWDGLDMVWG